MGAALGFAFKFAVAFYLGLCAVSFLTGYRWKERKAELERRKSANPPKS